MERALDRGARNRLVLVLAAAAALLVTTRFIDLQEYVRQSLVWVSDLGPAGYVAFGLLYVLAAILFIPGSLLTLGAGAVFGLFHGTLVVIISATLGAGAAFLVGRYLARDWVSAKIEGNEKFQAVDEAVAREGWKIVGLMRLSPIFPFNLLNYMFGLTQVSLKDYVAASFVGMIPGTIMYVYIGSLAGDLATLGLANRSRSSAEWALYVVGLLATVVVSLYVTRVARKALEKRVS
jgi:uncharacterized membrane protein YdjX (TVP38/TMEM64 family)